ncbi:MAG: translation initiation factor IF-2 subunit beta [Candidatus Heimdallarchaeota archaeon]|nr:translation initiation factor IF-2 subunit beta [Candidatus Heimdallarchaeota archaeon]
MWKEYSKNPDKVYQEILERAKAKLPEHKIDDNRFIIPKIDSQIQGNRTFLRNFKEILNLINRPESHFLKFISQELGTAGNVQVTQAIFQGKHSNSQLNKLLDRYVKDFLLCPECNKPDTKFVQHGRVQMMKCDACGASSSIRSVG